jgi:hypothetical protein
MRCFSIVRSLYFKIFSASFLITFLSPEIATSCYYYYYYHHIIIIIIIIIIRYGCLLSQAFSSWYFS